MKQQAVQSLMGKENLNGSIGKKSNGGGGGGGVGGGAHHMNNNLASSMLSSSTLITSLENKPYIKIIHGGDN